MDHDALRRILLEWDPIGLGADCPPDEYDCLIVPLLGLRATGAGAVAAFLRRELPEHFGLGAGDPEEVDRVAAAVVALPR